MTPSPICIANGRARGSGRVGPAGLRVLLGTIALFTVIGSAGLAQPTDVTVEGVRYTLVPKRIPSCYNITMALPPPVADGAVTVLFGYQDERNHYAVAFDGTSCTLRKVAEGKPEVLAANPLSREGAAAELAVRIERRPMRLSVVVDEHVAAEVCDATFGKGKIAIGGLAQPPDPAAVSVQKCAPIHVSDDFMVDVDQSIVGDTVEKRTAAIEEADPATLRRWTFVSGVWQLHSVMEDVMEADDPLLLERIAASSRRPDALRSPNPFSMEATAPGPGLAVIGYPFWDDYTAAVSVNSSGSQFGLVFGFRGPDNYFMLRWQCEAGHNQPQAVELVKATPAGFRVLDAATVPSRTGQWYRLRVATFGQRIRADVDGVVLFDRCHAGLTGGRAGLYAKGANSTHFDDVTIDTTAAFPLDSQTGLEYAGTAFAADAWRLRPDAPPDAGMQALVSKPTLCTVGPAFPASMVYTCRLLIPKSSRIKGSALALALQVGGPEHKLVYEFRQPVRKTESATQRLSLIKGDTDEVLAQFPTGRWSGKTRQFMLDLTDPRVARVYLDGRLEIRASLPEPVRGRFGFNGSGIRGLRVRDIQVAATRSEDRERPAQNIVFADDPYMLHWSAPQGAWAPVSDMTRFWHNGDFLDRFSIAMPFWDDATLLFCTDRGEPAHDTAAPLEPAAGYSLAFDPTTSTVRFRRFGRDVAAAAAERETGIELHRDGRYVWVRSGGKEVITFRDPAPPAGTRVALQTPRALDAEHFAAVRIERSAVIDDYFDHAPWQWYRTGTWEVTNRFACDPRWSHLAGRSEGAGAVLWSKAEYDGDLTVEFYAGHKMQAAEQWRTPLFYPRVGDINISVCGDGVNLDSGYTVTLAGWDRTWSETWTRLWREDQVVVETDRELIPRNRERYPSKRIIKVPWISAGRPIHGAWYYIKLRRVGNRVEYYFDNELVLTYEDPAPLKGRRIALWTYDNAVMFARAKISYTRKPTQRHAEPPPPKEVQDEDTGGPQPTVAASAAPAPRIVSSTHPGVLYSFEHNLEGWETVGGDGGALLDLDREEKPVPRRCLRLTNASAGGSFGARIPLAGMRLSGTRLQFNYCIPDDVKVNIYLKLDEPYERWYFVGVTGDSETTVKNVGLGTVARVRADGRWRPATFELGSALAALRPDDPDLRLVDMRIGNFHEGYAAVGIGGNREGCSYKLDELAVVTPAPGPVRAAIHPSSGAAAGTLLTLSRYAAPKRWTTAEKTAENGLLATTRSGPHYLHAWTPGAVTDRKLIASLPVDVLPNSLAVSRVYPTDGKPWGVTPVTVGLAPTTGPNLDLNSLQFRVNGTRINCETPTVRYAFTTRRLTVDLRWTPVVFDDGERVEFELAGHDVNGAPFQHAWSYTMQRSLDRYGPAVVELLGYPLKNSFTRSGAPCTNPWGREGALPVLMPKGGVNGGGYLKATNLALCGPSGLLLFDRPFNAGRTPLLTFDYKIPQQVHLDIILNPSGKWRNVRLTDVDTYNSPIFEVPDVVADDQWHHVEINLAEALRAAPFAPGMFDLSSICLADTGYQSAGPNASFGLDNLALVPAVSGNMGVTLRWRARDPSGISEYRYRWHERSSVTPTTKLPGDTTQITLHPTKEGGQYFHLQALDGNRRPSSVRHYRFLVDNTPPHWSTPAPAPGVRASPAAISVAVTDVGTGVDIDSLVMRVGAHTFRTGSEGLSYDPKTGVLSLDWADLPSAIKPFADGAKVRCSAGPVRDFAGNLSPTVQWDWTMDYSRDKTAPRQPAVSGDSDLVLAFETYEEDTGSWLYRGFDFSSYPVARTVRPGGGGSYCLRVYDYRRYEQLAIARTEAYDLAAFPIVCFEYRMTKGVDIDWIFQINGKPLRVRIMTTTDDGPPVIGAVPGAVADGKWHTAWFDLEAMVRESVPDTSNLQVEMVSLGSFNFEEQPSRRYFYIDSLMICAPRPAETTLAFRASDATGIAEYEFAVDQAPDTELTGDGRRSTVPRTKVTMPGSGMCFVHCRARDGAGLWGPTMHYPYCVAGPGR